MRDAHMISSQENREVDCNVANALEHRSLGCRW